MTKEQQSSLLLSRWLKYIDYCTINDDDPNYELFIYDEYERLLNHRHCRDHGHEIEVWGTQKTCKCCGEAWTITDKGDIKNNC